MLIEGVDCDENWGEGGSVGSGRDSRKELTVNYAIDRRSLFVPADRPLVDCVRNIDNKMNALGRRVGQGDGDKQGGQGCAGARGRAHGRATLKISVGAGSTLRSSQ